jgi:ABC-type multidrug transport system permease subunit
VGDFEDAANGLLERVYVDRFCASAGLSTTYGISIFVWFLALCRVVANDRVPGQDAGVPPGIGQGLTMPLFFASNAMTPIDIMPRWLQALSHVNLITCEVDILGYLKRPHAG